MSTFVLLIAVVIFLIAVALYELVMWLGNEDRRP